MGDVAFSSFLSLGIIRYSSEHADTQLVKPIFRQQGGRPTVEYSDITLLNHY